MKLNGHGSLVLKEGPDDIKIYEALQMHFHAPAEHTFSGKRYDLELHIVHQRYHAEPHEPSDGNGTRWSDDS